jgi:hypothetical protein
VTGGAYADLVAAYVSRRFACRSLKVYREISVGKTIIGKNRRIDVFCVCEANNTAFAIECKYQDSEGTVDEKVPYALDDLQALPMAGCIAYAGKGFSPGVLHMLEASPHAAVLPAGARPGRVHARNARAGSSARHALRMVGCARGEQNAVA